jgi:fatty-acyl-CoA synthase
MTTRVEFCRQLRERLLAKGDRVLLRMVVSPQLDRPMEFTGKEMLERAEQLVDSCHLQENREVVLLLLPHSPELFLLQLGLVLKGHIPAILPWPTTRVDAGKYQQNLVHQLSRLPANRLITLLRLATNLERHLPYATTSLALKNGATFEKQFPVDSVQQQFSPKQSAGPKTLPSEDTLFLQFSGGTTGAQKAIVVTIAMLTEQMTQLGETLQFTSEDSVASWLPLYHDMGLIACYWLPFWYGARSLQLAANDWILHPDLLLKYIARYGSTFCWLPNFSFSYLSQRREQMQKTASLESVRAWINCSEPVRFCSINEFEKAFATWGVRPEHVQASYAMAETVFAVTQSQLGRELMTVPRSSVNHSRQSYSQLAFDLIDDVYVSSGAPLPNTEIKIVAADNSPCGEAVAGEIYVRTPSLFSGYWGSEGFQTFSLHDGWHATGDYGFQLSGEIFVIGRFKDIVIVGGNNIFPEDVEAVVNNIPGVYPGRVVAFGVEDKDYGTQSLAIVAEMKEEFREGVAQELEVAVRKLVLSAIGIAPRYVSIQPQRWIVKSTAGKISRRETRERFLRELFASV